MPVENKLTRTPNNLDEGCRDIEDRCRLAHAASTPAAR